MRYVLACLIVAMFGAAAYAIPSSQQIIIFGGSGSSASGGGGSCSNKYDFSQPCNSQYIVVGPMR